VQHFTSLVCPSESAVPTNPLLNSIVRVVPVSSTFVLKLSRNPSDFTWASHRTASMFGSIYQLKMKYLDIVVGWVFSLLSLIHFFKAKKLAPVDTTSSISIPSPETDSHIPPRTNFVGDTNQLAPPTPPESDKGDDECDYLENIPLPLPSVNPIKVLDIDVGTPDAHVPRDPRLIRLTGVHPFNVEPPLSALFDSGMHLAPPIILNVRLTSEFRIFNTYGTLLCPKPWSRSRS